MAIIINNKFIVPLLILVLAFAVMVNNLSAKETKRDEFNRHTPLFSMVSNEYGGHEIIEDNNPASINQINKSVIDTTNNQVANANKKNEFNTSPDGSALIKTNIINPQIKHTRTEIEKYTVASGDTISDIAESFDLSANTILWANNLNKKSIIRPGDKLIIPPDNGIIYKVVKNDNLKKIAKTYQADEKKIRQANEKINFDKLAIGSTIFIPDGVPPAPKITPRKIYSSKRAIKNIFKKVPARSPVKSNTRLHWPANSHRINQYYHWGHLAIDIHGRIGDPAYAAESGKVIRAGWNRGGYGNYVIIDHGNGMQTLQAHFSKLLVKKGDIVRRGQTIALIGSTGRSTGPHIHFEVRVNGRKMNPLSYTR